MEDISKLRFAKTHEWVSLNGNVARVGISDHAQKEISDVVFAELPKIGREALQKESVMVVESVKAAFDIYAPMAGKIIRANDKLTKNPELINKSPYADGWLFEMECKNPKEFEGLLSLSDYEKEQANASHH